MEQAALISQHVHAGDGADRVRRTARRVLLALSSRSSAKPGIRVFAYHLMPPAEEFRRQIAMIRSRADIIDEATMLELISSPQPSNGKSQVVLSFDDGYLDNVNEESLSLTQELGVRPLVFVVAAAVKPSLGSPSRLVRDDNGEPYPLSTAADLRKAVAAGWSIGSHTSTHWDCSGGEESDFEREIHQSKLILEDAVGTEVRSFAYPWGRRENVSERATDWVEKSGYDVGFTTARGRVDREIASSRYKLPRDVVEPWWGPREVAGCLAASLDRFGWR